MVPRGGMKREITMATKHQLDEFNFVEFNRIEYDGKMCVHSVAYQALVVYETAHRHLMRTADDLSDLVATHKQALDARAEAEAALISALEVHYDKNGVPRALRGQDFVHLINAKHIESVRTESYSDLYYYTDLPAADVQTA